MRLFVLPRSTRCNMLPLLAACLRIWSQLLRGEEGLDFMKFSVYLLYELCRYSPCHIIQLALDTHFGHGIKYFMS